MGEVILCRDSTIGRDVAMKVLHAQRRSLPEARLRFSREMRIQGQLEHSSIAPVYDAGVDVDGTDYFTMKRVSGRTLKDVISALARRDAPSEVEFPPGRLLS